MRNDHFLFPEQTRYSFAPPPIDIASNNTIRGYYPRPASPSPFLINTLVVIADRPKSAYNLSD